MHIMLWCDVVWRGVWCMATTLKKQSSLCVCVCAVCVSVCVCVVFTYKLVLETPQRVRRVWYLCVAGVQDVCLLVVAAPMVVAWRHGLVN